MSRRTLHKAAAVQLVLVGLLLLTIGSGMAVVDTAADAIRRGSELLNEEQYQDAIRYFSQAIESSPDSIQAHELRARTYAELGEYVKALGDYRKLISLNPDNLTYAGERSMVYLQIEDYPDAVRDLTKIIAGGKDTMAYYTRGWAYGQVGEHEKAIADYTHFVNQTKDEASKADGYYSRGNEYFELNQSKKALDDFSKAAKLDSELKIAGSGGTRSIGGVGERQEVAIVPDYAKAYYRCGLVYSTLGKPQNAIENFSRALALNPDLPGVYKSRAEAYEKLGQHEKAKADEDKAASVGGKPAEKKAGGGAPAQPRKGLQLVQRTATVKQQGTSGADIAEGLDKFDGHLAELEKKALGRTYPDDLIPERLGRVELKILGKVQPGSYKHRLDQLMLKSDE